MTEDKRPELTRRAIEGIGPHRGNDWEIKPQTHRDLLPETGFADLKNILGQAPIKKLMEEYTDFDDKAGRAQTDYKSREKARIWLFFAALAIGALSIIPVERLLGPGVTSFMMAVQFIFVLIAIYLTINNLKNNQFNQWRDARAKAERARCRLFEETLKAEIDPSAPDFTPTTPDELPVALQKLEYVRRHHIEVQYDYFLGRGNQHLDNDVKRQTNLNLARGLGTVSTLLLVLLAVAGIHNNLVGLGMAGEVASFLAPSGAWHDKLFIALGTIAIGLQATLTIDARIDNDVTNASQYHQAARELAALYGDHLHAIRWQAAGDDLMPGLVWFRECNDLIVDEHKKWLEARSSDLEPLARLEELVERAK